MTYRAEHISVAIDRPPATVYAFVADPVNLPRWAAGLSGSIEQIAGDWVADSPMGRVTIRFADANPYGVLDHAVTLPSGETVVNPMRVVPNGDGSEVLFTVFQRPGVSDQELAADVQAVRRDLDALKALLEG